MICGFLRTSILINETAVYKRIRTKTFLGKKEFIGEITCVLMNVKQPSPEKVTDSLKYNVIFAHGSLAVLKGNVFFLLSLTN